MSALEVGFLLGVVRCAFDGRVALGRTVVTCPIFNQNFSSQLPVQVVFDFDGISEHEDSHDEAK